MSAKQDSPHIVRVTQYVDRTEFLFSDGLVHVLTAFDIALAQAGDVSLALRQCGLTELPTLQLGGLR